ncbi:hypothetical protein ACI3L1_19955, partial [Deinococcus sp. SM5_A1]|uniref:hypothetical protein n=1 Tax=Deinococcus sp. SM5_A1 TaxID=3379094 RepID=UPI003859735B
RHSRKASITDAGLRVTSLNIPKVQLAQVSGLILRSGRVQQVYREVVSAEATQIMSGELLIIDDIAAFLQRLLCA